MSFPLDENKAEMYNFHLEGRLIGTNVPALDVIAGKGLQTSVDITIQIPRSIFEKMNVATAAVTAFIEVEERKDTSKKGGQVMNAWKMGSDVRGKGLLALRWLAEITGSLSGELSKEATETNDEGQVWTLYFCTEGFAETVTMN